MSYGKYVLLSVEEHEDLMANRKEPDQITNILNKPMEDDVKLAHLRSELSSLVRKRVNDSKPEEPAKIAKIDKVDEVDKVINPIIVDDIIDDNSDVGVVAEMSEKNQLLEKLYKDPKHGFRGVSNLFSRARKLDPTITRKDVVSYLHTNDAYTRHFHKVKNIQHNPWVASGPDSHHMADLAMLPSLKKHNQGYCYILVVVDVFSRYLFVRPMKNKECSTTTDAYTDIIKSTWRIPSRLYTDKGTEFMGKTFKTLVKSLGIVHMNPKNTNVKACYAENAIMRIKNKLEKWFTASGSFAWTSVLDDIVEGLNSTYMDSIGTSPEKVTWKNAQKVWNRLYGSSHKRNPKFKVEDTVRVLLENSPFAKGTRAKWSEEVFKVVKVIDYDIPVYILVDELDREVDGIWYEEEMILYNNTDNLKKIDRVIRKRTKKGISECFVSFKGYGPAFNCWIPESELFSLNG
ncbi:unnamed protein product [Caenorhabditis nigoni]